MIIAVGLVVLAALVAAVLALHVWTRPGRKPLGRPLQVCVRNLTPHALNIRLEDQSFLVLQPEEGPVPRVAVRRTSLPPLKGLRGEVIPLYAVETGGVVDLPPPAENTILVVSAMVQAAARGRDDLVSPGELIRDEQGRVCGCRGLAISADS